MDAADLFLPEARKMLSEILNVLLRTANAWKNMEWHWMTIRFYVGITTMRQAWTICGSMSIAARNFQMCLSVQMTILRQESVQRQNSGGTAYRTIFWWRALIIWIRQPISARRLRLYFRTGRRSESFVWMYCSVSGKENRWKNAIIFRLPVFTEKAVAVRITAW